MQDNRGLTLLELIIVMAIISIISVVGISRYIGLQENAKIVADEAIASELARAAKMYLLQNENSIKWGEDGNLTISVENLSEKNLIEPDIEIQSERYKSEDKKVEITASSDYIITVKLGEKTAYPNPVAK